MFSYVRVIMLQVIDLFLYITYFNRLFHIACYVNLLHMERGANQKQKGKEKKRAEEEIGEERRNE